MKWLLIIALLLIIASLAGALVAMMRGDSASGDERRSRRMARALTVRISLSVLLFISYHLGWIQPTGIPMR
jgi:hypothetical protein